MVAPIFDHTFEWWLMQGILSIFKASFKFLNHAKTFSLLWLYKDKLRGKNPEKKQCPVVRRCPASWIFFKILFWSKNAKNGL